MRHKHIYFESSSTRFYKQGFSKPRSGCLLYIGIKDDIVKQLEETLNVKAITIAKVEEICRLLPALNNEIKWGRGQSKKSKDNVSYLFKNGSSIDILAARESSRGQRRHCIVVEEAILVDADALNDIIVPRLRRLWDIIQ